MDSTKVRTEAARLNEAEAKRVRERDLPVTNAIGRFKDRYKVEMVENGFNYDEKSNPGYISTFEGNNNPFDASESILGLDYLFTNAHTSVFGKILHNQSQSHSVSNWKPTYTLGDLSRLNPTTLASKAMSVAASIPANRISIQREVLLGPNPAAKEGPTADFSQYVVHALQKIAETPRYRAFSPKLRENYLQHSAKLIVLQLYSILTNDLTRSSFSTTGTTLGKDNISSVLEPVKTEYIGSFAEDRNRQHAIRVWKAQKKIVAAQQAVQKEAEPVAVVKAAGKATIGRSAAAPATKASAAPAAAKATKPETPKEAPKMVFALQFPATRPFQACKDSVLTVAGKLLLEEAVLAPWQLTSITSFDRNLAKLKAAKADGKAAKVATIKLDGATGEGKTHAINLLKEAYKDSINIISIDLNSSAEAIEKIAKTKSTPGKVTVVIVDELYFYDDKFLETVGKAGARDSATIEKLKAAYIRDLQAQGILVCVSGATENPLIYKLAAERIKDKLADAYEKLTKEEDRLFKTKLQESGKSQTTAVTNEELDGIEIGDSDESKKLKEYIEAQKDKLARKTSTADRMDRKRKTIQAKISSADSTYAKSEQLDSYHLIDPNKLKQNKSTLYILPDIDAKGFSAVNCKEVVGDQNCVVITPFFLNAGQPNQCLRYKIWTKTNGTFTAQEVPDEDIGKAFAALNSTLPRVIIYDKTTAVGGDLGGLALGVEDIVLQYKSAGKSWDDAVQNAGRDRTPKEKDASDNEILTAKFHVISDKGSKKELVSSLEETQEAQDAERMAAYLGGKKEKTAKYLEGARDQVAEFTQKLGTAKDDYDLGAAGRYRKKIEDEKRREEAKKAEFDGKKLELLRKLTEFEELIAAIEESDEQFPTIAATAKDLSLFFGSHGELLEKIGTDVEKGVVALRSKAAETKIDLDGVAESLAEDHAANQARVAAIKQAREEIRSLKDKIDAAQKETNELPDTSSFESIYRNLAGNIEQSNTLASTSAATVKEARKLKALAEEKQQELLSKIDAARTVEALRLRELDLQKSQQAVLERLLAEQKEKAHALLRQAINKKQELELALTEGTLAEDITLARRELLEKKEELFRLKNPGKERSKDAATDPLEKDIEDLQKRKDAIQEDLRKEIENTLSDSIIDGAKTLEGIEHLLQKGNESLLMLDGVHRDTSSLNQDITRLLKSTALELEETNQTISRQKTLSAAQSAASSQARFKEQELSTARTAKQLAEGEEARKLAASKDSLRQQIDGVIYMLKVAGKKSEDSDSEPAIFEVLKSAIEYTKPFKEQIHQLEKEFIVLQVRALAANMTESPSRPELNARDSLEAMQLLENQAVSLEQRKNSLLSFLLTEKDAIEGITSAEDLARNEDRILLAARTITKYEAEADINKKKQDPTLSIFGLKIIALAHKTTEDAQEAIDSQDDDLEALRAQNREYEVKIAKKEKENEAAARKKGSESERQKRAREEKEKLNLEKLNASSLLDGAKEQAASLTADLAQEDARLANTELKEALSVQRKRLAQLNKAIRVIDGGEELEDEDLEVRTSEADAEIERLKALSEQLRKATAEITQHLEEIDIDRATSVAILGVKKSGIDADKAMLAVLEGQVGQLKEQIASANAIITKEIEATLVKFNEASAILRQKQDEQGGSKAEALRRKVEEDAKRRELEQRALREAEVRRAREEAVRKGQDSLAEKKALLQSSYTEAADQFGSLSEGLVKIGAIRQKLEERAKRDSADLGSDDAIHDDDLEEIERIQRQEKEIKARLGEIETYLEDLDPKTVGSVKTELKTIATHLRSLEEIKSAIVDLKEGIEREIENNSPQRPQSAPLSSYKARAASAPTIFATPRGLLSTRQHSAPEARKRTEGSPDPATMKTEIALTQALIKAAAMIRPDTKPADWEKEYGTTDKAKNETMQAYLTRNNKAMATVVADGTTNMNEIVATIGSENATLKAYGNACIKIKKLLLEKENTSLTADDILQQIWDPKETKPAPNASIGKKNAFRKKSESFLSVPEKSALIAMHIATSDPDSATRGSYKNLGLKLSEKASDNYVTMEQATAALKSLMAGSKLNDSLKWVANPENIFNAERKIYDKDTKVPKYSIAKTVKFSVNGKDVVELPCPTFKMREAAQALLDQSKSR